MPKQREMSEDFEDEDQEKDERNGEGNGERNGTRNGERNGERARNGANGNGVRSKHNDITTWVLDRLQSDLDDLHGQSVDLNERLQAIESQLKKLEPKAAQSPVTNEAELEHRVQTILDKRNGNAPLTPEETETVREACKNGHCREAIGNLVRTGENHPRVIFPPRAFSEAKRILRSKAQNREQRRNIHEYLKREGIL